MSYFFNIALFAKKAIPLNPIATCTYNGKYVLLTAEGNWRSAMLCFAMNAWGSVMAKRFGLIMR